MNYIIHADKNIKKVKNADYYRHKSDIAGKVATTSFIAMLISAGMGLMVATHYQEKINDLDNSKQQVYQEFKETEDFNKIFRQEFEQISNAYIERKISFEEFEEKLKYIQSIEYAQQTLQNSNHKLNDDIAKLDNKAFELSDKSSKNIAYNIAMGSMLASSAPLAGGLIADLAYLNVAEREEKKKKEQEQTLS